MAVDYSAKSGTAHLADAAWGVRQARGLAANASILMVGAGGIGCELLKNLVLAGFKRLVIIDLDTIDVTNLNRQFLFQKRHVGQSKAQVAKEAALAFCPEAQIRAIHDSIMSPDYGLAFFQQFQLVLNALDNRAARSHVNRMCLAANVPLVESGTAGYLGQVTVIRKGETECYECTPKPHAKTFPGCTIRNTPSEPIHCIVWSKHLFNQLFGETDPDEEVSPDAADPEANDEQPTSTEESSKATDDSNSSGQNGNVVRISTRQWAQDLGYEPTALFQKFFFDDIKYLLSMEKLWSKRKAPVPIDVKTLANPATDESSNDGQSYDIQDQAVWSVQKCFEVFQSSILALKGELQAKGEGDHLVWDKDDEAAMNFVTACSNIRAEIFHIKRQSRFDIKSMAGNIIPAIATTNAVIAGLIVLEALKILAKKPETCKTAFLTRKPNPRGKILVPCQLNPPNPKCYVCAEKPEVSVKLSLEKTTLKMLEEKILKGALHMVAPDVEIQGKGVILISSEEGETTANADKTLKSFGLTSGTILECDDFLQNYNLKLFLFDIEEDSEEEFQIITDISELKAKEDEQPVDNKPSEQMAENSGDRKRKAEEETVVPIKKKKAVELPAEGGDDQELVCID